MPLTTWLPWLRMLRKLDHSADCLEAHGIDAGDYLKIIGVSTHPSAQGMGLCSALMAAITARADSEGRHCFLEAVPTGVDRFYERFGFETVEVMRVELPRGPADFKLMVRRPGGGGKRAKGAAPGGAVTISACAAGLEGAAAAGGS